MTTTTEPARDINDAYDLPNIEPMDDKTIEQQLDRFAALGKELQQLVSGPVHLRPDAGNLQKQPYKGKDAVSDYEMAMRLADATPFEKSTALFNSAAYMAAWMVVKPQSTADVSATLAFCKRHKLSPSARSGGFSTAGWAIQGDVILDMREMNDIQLFPRGVTDVSQLQAFRRRSVANRNSKGRSSESEMSGEGSSKRQKSSPASSTDAAGQHRFATPQGSDGAQRTTSGESGADADAESSSGNGSRNAVDESRSGSASQADHCMKEEDEEGHIRQLHSAAISPSNEEAIDSLAADAPPSALQKSAAAREWAERVSSENAASRDSGSGGNSRSSGGSRTHGSGSAATPVTSSVDVEMAEDKSDNRVDSPVVGVGSTQQIINQGDPSTSIWERHHRPMLNSSSSSSGRLVLPTTGGFVWTAGDGANKPPSTRPLNANDPVYLGGATLPDLQAAQSGSTESYASTQAAFASMSSSRLYTGAQATQHTGNSPMMSRITMANGTNGDAKLPPGIHKDKMRLVEFGPGVGVRELDVHTSGIDASKSSPTSPTEAKMDKGKARHMDLGTDQPDDVESVQMHSAGLDFTRDGVPYHVPLSAYPVGSTAMTIGGFGYLSRSYGLSLDNIVELELVLADGRIKQLNEASAKSEDTEERELWWAVRGAAPCFGIVTRIVAKAYPVPRVYAGNLIFPFNPATAPSLVRHWRDCLKGTGEQIPRELYSNLILTAGPADARRDHVIVIQICYLGTSSNEEVGASFVQAIGSWTGERMLLKDVSEKSFLSQQDGVAQVLKSGHGRRWIVRGDLLTTLTDEVIGRTISQFVSMGNRAVWLFELVGGAIEDNGHNDETCVGLEQRQAKFTAAALQQWVEEHEDTRCVQGVEKWVTEILAPASVGGPFAAFLERGESRKRCEGSFGAANLQRLIQLKRRIDPDGVFTHTFGRGLQQFVEDEDRAAAANSQSTA